ncbi:RNA polymerase sigma factor [Dubosiella muris]|mgnify:CR=1 FL=1|uniref:Sigma-70 family RNA polymerase sigma factor n=1 Tax=Dubosiella muris TaxID=3038133 RepID=A0AC61RA69_9FIRM|nr:sigma-70 family RNA polymerase sigma factor [Dubosiella muris]TGY67202.1 sigma-70 family RNA polymerase sigma factor [Dubosiella muris]
MENFEQVYQEHARLVYRYLLSQCHDEFVAEELCQETFYQAFRSLKQYDGTCRLSTWLCAIAKNQLRAYRRKHPAMEELDDRWLAASSENERGKVELLRAMQTLPAPQRDIVYLRMYGNLSFAQIGDVLEKNETWARINFYRAKEKLRKEMENNENEFTA